MSRLFPSPSTRVKIALQIDPDNYDNTTGTITSAAVDTLGFSHAMLILLVGDMVSGATLDVKLRSSSASAGTYADVTGAALAQQVDATDDNTVSAGVVRLHGENRYLKVVSTQATDGSDLVDWGAVLLLFNPDKDSDVDTTYDFDV